LSKNTKNSQQDLHTIKFENFAFLSLVVILILICITALFTAMALGTGPYETPYRLHMRYYNFALPLFYIIALGSFSKAINIDKYMRYIIGTIFIILSIYAIQTNLAPYSPTFVDGPEIFGIHANHGVFIVIGVLGIIALLSWIFFQRVGISQYFYVLLPLFVGVSSFNVWLELDKQKNQSLYDKAGIITKEYMAADDISKTIVVGSDLGNLFRTLFYLDNPKTSFNFIPENSTYDLSKLNSDKEWILLIGQHDLIGKSFYQIPLNGFSLINVSKIINLDFRVNNWPIISRAKGLSSPESWGTWSNSSVVEFNFNFPLPEKFELHLVASAFGPNVGAEVSVKSGSITKKVTLSENGRLQVLLFENKEKSNSLVFVIPKATSPKDLGLGEDTRKLGIGFVQIKIVAI
jgi:phosphoglycerol transferase